MAFEQTGEFEVESGIGYPLKTTFERILYTPSKIGYHVFDTDFDKPFVWTSNGWELVNEPAKLQSLTNLLSLDTILLREGQIFFVDEYVTNSLMGGGIFAWDSTKPKTEHDGGLIISPTVPFDGLQPSVEDFLNGVNETQPAGTGAFVRQNVFDFVDVAWFGATGLDLSISEFAPLQKALTATYLLFLLPSDDTTTSINKTIIRKSYSTDKTLTIHTNCVLEGNANSPYPVISDTFANAENWLSGSTLYALSPFTGNAVVHHDPDNSQINNVIIDGELLTFGTWWPAFTVTSNDSGNAVTKTLKLAVQDPNDDRQDGSIRILTKGIPGILMNAGVFTFQLEAVGGDRTQQYTWSGQGTLPAGLTLSSDGILSGTPTAAGEEFYKFIVSDSQGDTNEITFLIKVHTHYITTDFLPGSTEGATYLASVETSSSDGTPVFYHMNYGPTGISIDRVTGVISGTVDSGAGGEYEVQIAISTDDEFFTQANIVHSVYLPLDVSQLNETMSIENIGFAGEGWRQNEFNSHPFYARGGDGTFVYSIAVNRSVAGFENGQTGFPTVNSPGPGLTLSNDGILSGIPTSTGSYNFFIRAESVTAPNIYFWEELVIINVPTAGEVPTIDVDFTLPPAIVGQAYSYQLPTSNLSTGALFEVKELPSGLSLDSATGIISGTPVGSEFVNGLNCTWSSSGSWVTARNFRAGSGIICHGPTNLHRYEQFLMRNCDIGLNLRTQCFDSRFESFYIAHCRQSVVFGSGAAANILSNGRLEFCFETQMDMNFAHNAQLTDLYFDTSGWEALKISNCNGWVLANCIFNRSGRLVFGPGTEKEPFALGQFSNHINLIECRAFSITSNTTQKGSNIEGYDGTVGVFHPDFIRPSSCIAMFNCSNGTINGNDLTGCAHESFTIIDGNFNGVNISGNSVNDRDFRGWDGQNLPKIPSNILTNGNFADFSSGGTETASTENSFTFSPAISTVNNKFATSWEIVVGAESGLSNSITVTRNSFEDQKEDNRAGVGSAGIQIPSFYYINIKKNAEPGAFSGQFQDIALQNSFLLRNDPQETLKLLNNRRLVCSLFARSHVDGNFLLPRIQTYLDTGDNNYSVIEEFKGIISLTPEWKKHRFIVDISDFRMIRVGNNPNFELRLIMDDASIDVDIDIAAIQLSELAPTFLGEPYQVDDSATLDLTPLSVTINPADTDSSWQVRDLIGVSPNTIVEVAMETASDVRAGVRPVSDTTNADIKINNSTSTMLVKTNNFSQIEVFASDSANTTFTVINRFDI